MLKALTDILPSLASGLSFPKTMRWGPGGVRFARPVRWVLTLLGGKVVPLTFAGVRSGRVTYGHRILSPDPITVADARGFETALKQHRVLLDPSARRHRITLAAAGAARGVRGRPILDPDLLEETVQLVEWPEALAGTFAPEFLTLPREVLITVMRHHQKYFSVEDGCSRGSSPSETAGRAGSEPSAKETNGSSGPGSPTRGSSLTRIANARWRRGSLRSRTSSSMKSWGRWRRRDSGSSGWPSIS